MIANETEKMNVQAGLEDFGYMENMTSVAQLREQITITGAEVWKINFHQLSKQTQWCHSGRLEQLYLGRPLCHRRRCQVSETTFQFDADHIFDSLKGAWLHLPDHAGWGWWGFGVFKGEQIFNDIAKTTFTFNDIETTTECFVFCTQVGDSEQWFILLGLSGCHYTLYCTQV